MSSTRTIEQIQNEALNATHISESERIELMKQLVVQLLDDDYGITVEAYDSLCALADNIGIFIDDLGNVGCCDGRVYFKSEY